MWWCSDVKLISGACCARVAIVCCRVEMVSDLGMSGIVPLRRSAIRRPLPSTGSRRVSSPASSVLRGVPTPCRPSRRTSLPSLGGTALCARRSLPSPAERGRRRPGDLCQPASPRSGSACGGGRASQVPGEPHCVHALLSDPGGTSTPGHLGASVLPSAIVTTSAPTIRMFRGSITRPAHSLSTLRHHGRPWPRKTRFRLLAKLCRAGLVTRWVPVQGFRVLPSHPPCPGFAWRTTIDPRDGPPEVG